MPEACCSTGVPEYRTGWHVYRFGGHCDDSVEPYLGYDRGRRDRRAGGLAMTVPRVVGPGRMHDGTDKGAQPQRNEGVAAWSRKYLSGAAVLLLLVVVSVVSVDWLAAGISDGVRANVRAHLGGWWGSREESHWADAVSTKNGLRATSRDLVIRISGDRLTAQYTVTAPADSVFAKRVSAAGVGGNSGDDLVNNVLGAVQVAEYRYGFTGSQHFYATLTFRYIPRSTGIRRRKPGKDYCWIGPIPNLFQASIYFGGEAFPRDHC